jgi:hypothetical protein
MWPGRRYWIWSLAVWLVLTAALLADIAWGPFFRGPLYWTALNAWFAFWTPLLAFVALVMGLAGKALRGATRLEPDWRWFAVWVLWGLATAAVSVWFGPAELGSAIPTAALLAYLRGFRRSAFGLMAGLGSLLLLFSVGENARMPHGCQAVANEPNTFSCPNHAGLVLPFALGLLLLLCGAVAQLRRRASY